MPELDNYLAAVIAGASIYGAGTLAVIFAAGAFVWAMECFE